MTTPQTTPELQKLIEQAIEKATGKHRVLASYDYEDVFAACEAALAARVTAAPLEGVSVPPGYALVPIEATPEMKQAGYLASNDDSATMCGLIFAAMVSAAPPTVVNGVVNEAIPVVVGPGVLCSVCGLGRHVACHRPLLSGPNQGEPMDHAFTIEVREPGGALLARAADFLEWYVAFIKEAVMSVDIERHPYLPELEEVAAKVRALSVSAAPVPTVPTPEMLEAAFRVRATMFHESEDDKNAAVFSAMAAVLPPGRGMVPMDWQPIETAPKDGTHILGFMRGRVCEAFLTPRDDCEMWTFGMWTSSDGRAKPTHWMPLPKAPAHGIKEGS